MELKFIYTKVLPLALLGLAAILGIINWKKLEQPVKLAVVIAVFNVIIETAGHVMASNNSNNVWLYNLADALRYLLWFYYFFISFGAALQKKYAATFLFIFPVIYAVTIFMQPLSAFQTISFVSGGILLLSCCIVFLLNEYSSNNTEKLTNNPHFWICTGLLIYYALTLPFIGLYNTLFKTAPAFSKIYFLICVIGSSLILSIFMIKAFTCQTDIKKYGI